MRSTPRRIRQKARYAFLNHPLPMIAQEDTEGGNPRRHIYGHDLIFSEEDGERDSYYHYDAIGSVVNTTDQSGELMWSYGYEPFGEGRFAEAFRENPEADPLPPSTLMGFTGVDLLCPK